MRASLPLLGLSGLLIGFPSAAQVQLRGRVIDDQSEQPVPGATVTVANEHGRRIARQVAGDDGTFQFVLEPSGAARIHAERIGYRRAIASRLPLEGFSDYELEIRLSVDALVLAPVEVVARSRSGVSPTLAGFEQRLQSGIGWFVTRPQIEERNPARVTDLLTMAPGVSLIPVGPSRRKGVFMSRSETCPAQIYVDGFHMNRPTQPGTRRATGASTEAFPLDEVVMPGDVHGIEVYDALAKVPSEFLGPGAVCGVVAVWTRRR